MGGLRLVPLRVPVNQAFSGDLKQLMEQAKPLVDMASRYSAKLTASGGSAASADETAQFRAYVLSMGIDNPVTREAVGPGSRYHRELARELASFLPQVLGDHGGSLTLTDAYCLYNRARGNVLVSPLDLKNACAQFEALHLPVRMVQFPSGVIVLEDASRSPELVVQDTQAAVAHASDTGLSGAEYARLTGVSVTVARERLLRAEREGLVCRDDTVEGLRFFPNRFLG